VTIDIGWLAFQILEFFFFLTLSLLDIVPLGMGTPKAALQVVRPSSSHCRG